EEMCWKKMTQTGSTPNRKNRKRGSACAAVDRRRRVVVEGAPSGRGPFFPLGSVALARTSPAAMDVALSTKNRYRKAIVARIPPIAGPIAMPRLIARRYTANADFRRDGSTVSAKNDMAAG